MDFMRTLIFRKKIEQYQNDLEASKTEYDKPFAYSKELEEKLARQCELNASLTLRTQRLWMQT